MPPRAVTELLKSAASKWSDHNAPRLGAALAYYMLLSIAPLVILAVGICGIVFNRTVAERELLEQIRRVAGYSEANTVRTLLDNAHRASSGIPAATVALITLLFGASGVFVELRESLNIIWDAPRRRSSTWRSLLQDRFASVVMVFGFALLLLVSLLVSAGFTVAGKFFSAYVPLHTAIAGEAANFVLSFAAIAVLFALIFKFVPDVPIAWRDVGIGAAATALLFTIGKSLLALYIGTAGVGSTYGAAGSLVALVVWVYYSAQIFFFGAEITRVYADLVGSRSGNTPVPQEPRGKAAVN
ncbi:MAG: YihY/virulence factor BrkB family protein [Acidobacteriaceae bacterium]|nr:YihY/virulence factor BrkB family protein [Acidobacteriaceae bacterium]MBV9780771.1 YihY/virulence factor BrkB family protein [Acidobacteriaceae bacterium]